MDNEDLLNRQNSFNKLAPLSLPKANLSFLPGNRSWAPSVAFSYGEAFHTADPRMGKGTAIPNLVAPSRAYQLLFTKDVKQTRLSVALRRVSNSQELAKIDPDTGLQEAIGPSINKVVSITVAHHYARGSLFVSYAGGRASKPDGTARPRRSARDLGCIGLGRTSSMSASRERRIRIRQSQTARGWIDRNSGERNPGVDRADVSREPNVSGANFLLPGGYAGQTTEVLAFPSGSPAQERIVGVPLRTSFGLTCTYNIRR